MKKQKKSAPRDLREGCINEALRIVASRGIEALSLREVARRLNVSHGAPYRHFPSREHIHAELVSRAFEDFARHLDGRKKIGEPNKDLEEMGRAYLSYAISRPLNYHLMFSSALPNPDDHQEMMKKARYAFDMLKDGLASVHAESRRPITQDELDLDALYVWATMHGLASVMMGEAVKQTSVAPSTLQRIPNHVFKKMEVAIRAVT